MFYPTPEKIVEFNILALEFTPAKKAERAVVLNMPAIRDVLDECENTEGDIYDFAVILLKGLVQKHPFASGNRRTAFIATKYFVLNNKGKFGIADNPEYAKVLQGVRERYYSDSELKKWINNGKIRQFKR